MNKNFTYIINNMIKILDIYFNHLLPLEIENKQNTEEFTFYLKKLNIYKKKENRLTQNVVFIISEDALEKYIPDDLTEMAKDLIVSRVNYIITRSEENEYLEMIIDDDDIDFDDDFDILKVISNIKLEYLNHTFKKSLVRDRLIVQKYKMIFTDINVEDELSSCWLNPNNVSTNDDIQALALEMDEDDYIERKKQLTFELSEEVLMNIVGNKNDIQNNLEFFAYLFNKLDENEKNSARDAIGYDLEDELLINYDDKRNVYDIVCDITNTNEYKKDDIKNDKKDAKPYIFSLIDLENKIYNTVFMLKENKTSKLMNKLDLLIKEEKSLLEVIDFLDITFKDIVDYLNEYENNVDKLNMIVTRLKNLFEIDIDDYYLGKTAIDGEFENRYMSRLDEMIKKTNSDDLNQLKFVIIYTLPHVTEKFVLSNDNISKLLFNDNELNAYFSNIDIEEYKLDKEELMIEIIKALCNLIEEDEMNDLYEIMLATAAEILNELTGYEVYIEKKLIK